MTTEIFKSNLQEVFPELTPTNLKVLTAVIAAEQLATDPDTQVTADQNLPEADTAFRDGLSSLLPRFAARTAYKPALARELVWKAGFSRGTGQSGAAQELLSAMNAFPNAMKAHPKRFSADMYDLINEIHGNTRPVSEP